VTMFGAVNMASTLEMAIGPWTAVGFTTPTTAIAGSISARSGSGSEPSRLPSPSARRGSFR